jgi:hypothetical protein
MAKGRTVEDQLAKVSALRGMGAGVLATALGKFLESKINLVAAKAADIAREAGVKSLEGKLAEAFWRFMKDPAKTDKGCAAKKAIAEALYEMGCESPAARDVLLAGVKHVQVEPGWGENAETGGELRGVSALGLVRMAHRDVMTILVDLLMDTSFQARMIAARAIAYAGRDEGALLLRLKLLAGDSQEGVLAECLTALGRLGGIKSLEFIGRYLDDPEEPGLFGAAAMAIGEMRRKEGFDVLKQTWEAAFDTEMREQLLLPIALCRLPESVDFLVGVIQNGVEKLAQGAVEALAIYKHDSAVRERVEKAVRGRGAAGIIEGFGKAFA